MARLCGSYSPSVRPDAQALAELGHRFGKLSQATRLTSHFTGIELTRSR
jgi:hypothetical protein